MCQVYSETIPFITIQTDLHMFNRGLDSGTALCLLHFVSFHRNIQQIEPILHFSNVISSRHHIQHIIIQFILQFGKHTHIVIFYSFLDDSGVDFSTSYQQIITVFHIISASIITIEYLISRSIFQSLFTYGVLTLLNDHGLHIYYFVLGQSHGGGMQTHFVEIYHSLFMLLVVQFAFQGVLMAGFR